jgi:hypothetical protein
MLAHVVACLTLCISAGDVDVLTVVLSLFQIAIVRWRLWCLPAVAWPPFLTDS